MTDVRFGECLVYVLAVFYAQVATETLRYAPVYDAKVPMCKPTHVQTGGTLSVKNAPMCINLGTDMQSGFSPHFVGRKLIVTTRHLTLLLFHHILW